MPEDEDKCKCPGCNCFSGLVHVKTDGTYMVFPGGRVAKVKEASYRGSYRERQFEVYEVVIDRDDDE